MCMPKAPTPTSIPERQALKLPDSGSTADLTDDIAKRRRAMSASAYTGTLGLGTGPQTTTVLGG